MWSSLGAGEDGPVATALFAHNHEDLDLDPSTPLNKTGMALWSYIHLEPQHQVVAETGEFLELGDRHLQSSHSEPHNLVFNEHRNIFIMPKKVAFSVGPLLSLATGILLQVGLAEH